MELKYAIKLRQTSKPFYYYYYYVLFMRFIFNCINSLNWLNKNQNKSSEFILFLTHKFSEDSIYINKLYISFVKSIVKIKIIIKEKQNLMHT